MKKIARSVFLAAALVSLAGLAQAAPDRVGRLGLGVMGGGAFNDQIDNTGFVQANLDWGLTRYLAIGVEGGWQEATANAPDEEFGAVHVMGDFIVRSPDFHENLVPYGVLGLGVIGAYVTDEDGVAATNNGDDVDDTAFAWKIGGGVEWFFSENWVLGLELAYFDGSNDLPRTSLGDDQVEYWTAAAGLRFVF